MSSPELPAPPPAPRSVPPPAPALPVVPEQPAGWFPDPNGRHEHRYFNGRAWTADVADAGHRSVDPLGAAPSPHHAFPPTAAGQSGNGNGIATAALVCGIIAVLLAWVPFIVVAGFVLAVLAIAFGVQGLRRSAATDRGRGKAIAGLVLGAVGVALSVIGVIFSVVVFREVRAFMDPEAHTLEVTDCTVGDGVARVSGTLTNLSSDRAEFSLFVTVSSEGRLIETDAPRELPAVGGGATVEWQVTTLAGGPAGDCTASVDVYGPLPFGVEMDRP